jgi:respiratory burst oxidase
MEVFRRKCVHNICSALYVPYLCCSCDKNGDGHITGEEVKEVIVLSASANKLTKLKEQAEEYAALIMEELDVDQMGYIELSQLKALMRGSVAALNKEAIIQYTQTLIPQKTKNRIQRFMDRSRLFLMENWKHLWIIVLWLGAMAGLFSWKFVQYRHKNAFIVMGYCVCVAKGSIETVKLNMALILLLVCRNSLTWLRSTKLGSFIPFDDNLEFHKIVAAAIGVGALLHSTMHITCDLPRVANAPHEKFERSLGEDFNYHQPTFWDLVKTVDGITGIAMVILMSIAFLFASRWFRRSLVKLPRPFHRMTGFNAFWYTHHIFIIVYVLLIVHGQMLVLRNKWYHKTVSSFATLSISP